ncbi:MAG: hypothetical protein NZ869_04370 [Thermoanaerobaculum sp.]|nr:hypothetical protein [Thermoanaerobaculum sp.]MCX7895437.1 hypothetical protein [Thermoanaerobaculum sp.]MDW7967094.1 hypothetical protein [Thermoanaerobaculum sp.]
MARRRSCAEYFLALVGLALLVFLLGIILTPGSCRVGFFPEAEKSWVHPTPTPSP